MFPWQNFRLASTYSAKKRIDYSTDKIKKLLALVAEKGVKFEVGFNRQNPTRQLQTVLYAIPHIVIVLP